MAITGNTPFITHRLGKCLPEGDTDILYGVVSIDVEITPETPDQELNLNISYWEGASRVAGTSAALAVTGHAHVELTGYAPGGVAAPR